MRISILLPAGKQVNISLNTVQAFASPILLPSMMDRTNQNFDFIFQPPTTGGYTSPWRAKSWMPEIIFYE